MHCVRGVASICFRARTPICGGPLSQLRPWRAGSPPTGTLLRHSWRGSTYPIGWATAERTGRQGSSPPPWPYPCTCGFAATKPFGPWRLLSVRLGSSMRRPCSRGRRCPGAGFCADALRSCFVAVASVRRNSPTACCRSPPVRRPPGYTTWPRSMARCLRQWLWLRAEAPSLGECTAIGVLSLQVARGDGRLWPLRLVWQALGPELS